MKVEEFKKLFSNKRIESFEERYEKPVKFYLKNITVSSSYYEFLHIFEIILRNKVAKHLRKNYPDWFLFESVFMNTILKKEQKDQLNTCLKRLKTYENQKDENRIISELSLGFWTSLFNKSYDQTIWKKKEFKSIFPHFSKGLGTLSKELDQIRRIRNRIMHYEQILTYEPEKNYELIYQYLCNMIPKHFVFREKLKEMNRSNVIKKIINE